ncbi:MAG: UDP-4-amino-4,6-dideoxy-N-acetyl-beta-L-altrosamine N-acetyltransferase [Sulfurimonas sp. RIFCSPHIGHO2_12_FULL_36_9]|uniref:UDP-4-amino-4, 6-dideoxy-N-acetyl-beta-L-altrosamine N-acetyltransferase n=1 Tax=Sulfurimonas sp. RIFCSPLOWO2_12_36_12 TaxID=1802253 RepID=UPI0008BA42A0|nr:UDP-4-amino-4,6-dideoxy-N-acetyl-beta-L-altrosamine N-acetyltransferase [Sulfurimonas sp. RIFCSPLOWO2_12_36_12]OHD98040.1 MAG: UDP-4-amino-4,6-dideoxy-N-acetyl-beta-L-altrosamine N-acetyltransferase [Sulfurimonas sp. RIFCSPHIGHO2_12_FULL_36_9]OHE01065.1 MAG: UDP-4-amino-4,6-dideoxy-N-acetyl-beta-L-altrosamine N-acetyltransferase [Sulfurimonas sp. RIFCSPLOWO2_12_36_12]
MSDNIVLINFIDLTLEEKKMILSWRNHPSIKQWMYNSDDILLENHLNFIETLKSCADKLYFLVKLDDDYIGVIDFTNIDKESKSSEFGLYANIELKGMGKVLLNSICEYGFHALNINKLIAEVFAKNEKAINLYKKFNFKDITRKTVNNKEIICMELKNEKY